ncbi:hypothetical protein BH09MYX1_BH09MYX1_54980 [soil metagenome]
MRAGSSVAWFGKRLAVVQDDANFVALIDGSSCRAITLPSGRGGKRQFDDVRGNKKDKLDLEASVVLGGKLHAFGSGSLVGRDRVLRVDATGVPSVIAAPRLYAALAARTDFSGSELNVEGALAIGDDLWFFNRGNGAPRGELRPVDATVRTTVNEILRYLHDEARAPVPVLEDVTIYDLGSVGGCRLTFTDATFAFGRSVYLAAAEDSPDVTRDGPVTGVAIGFLDDEPRYALVLAEDGAPLCDKLEGIAPGEDGRTLLAVVDKDDPGAPSEVIELEVTF